MGNKARVLGKVLVLVGGLVLGLGTGAAAICVDRGDPAKGFSLPSLDGEQVSLAQYEGKVVLLVFWSSWCSRCREEMAFLEKLTQGASGDLVVLAINQETEHVAPERVAELRAQVEEMGLPFPVLLDPGLEVWGAYCVNALPTSVLVDRQGRVAFAEPNFYWASPDHLTGALAAQGVLRN